MSKLTIAKIYLGLLALGLVILGFLFPEIGLVVFIFFGWVALVFGLPWALAVVLAIWDN